jgi:hypothetical protein
MHGQHSVASVQSGHPWSGSRVALRAARCERCAAAIARAVREGILNQLHQQLRQIDGIAAE